MNDQPRVSVPHAPYGADSTMQSLHPGVHILQPRSSDSVRQAKVTHSRLTNLDDPRQVRGTRDSSTSTSRASDTTEIPNGIGPVTGPKGPKGKSARTQTSHAGYPTSTVLPPWPNTPRVFPGRIKTSGAIEIPLWILVLDDLSAGAKMLYGVLALLAAGKKAVSDVSVEVIAKYLRASTRSVQIHTRELERYALVARDAPLEGEVTSRYVFFDHPARYRDGTVKSGNTGGWFEPGPHYLRRADIKRDVLREVFEDRRDRRQGRTK